MQTKCWWISVAGFVPIAALALFPVNVCGQESLSLVEPNPYVMPRDAFVESIVDSSRPQMDRLLFDHAVFYPVVQAGSATVVPFDSPSNRVDPNVGGEFGGVGSLRAVHPTLGPFICSASVIDDDHILTAAHCFDFDSDGMVDPGLVSEFILNNGSDNSSIHSISTAYIHPDFSGFTSGANDDIAVAKLSTAVPVGTPQYALRSTPMAMGDRVTLVGYGQSGFGDTGFTIDPSFNVKRVGENIIDVLVEDDFDDDGKPAPEGFEPYLFDFDGPLGTGVTGGGTLGNDLETILGGGDSGSPALVLEGTEWVISGVNSFQLVLAGIPSIGVPGFFDSLAGGNDIAPYRDWVVSVVPEPATSFLLPCLGFLAWRRRRSQVV